MNYTAIIKYAVAWTLGISFIIRGAMLYDTKPAVSLNLMFMGCLFTLLPMLYRINVPTYIKWVIFTTAVCCQFIVEYLF
jgi:hypothetical protein